MSLLSPRVVSVALFITAGVNLLAGLTGVAAPQLNAQIFLGPDVVLEGIALRYHYILWFFVFAMGVGYAVAARDPERQTGLLIAAALGKLSIVVIWGEMLTSGHGAWPLIGGMVFDGCMGLLW